MGYSRVHTKARRRKVAHLAAYSRQHTVKNMPKNKPTFDQKNLVKVVFNEGKDVHMVQVAKPWEKKKYPQPKPMMKKHWKVWFTKEYKEEFGCDVYERHCKLVHSTFPNPQDFQKKLWKNMGKAAKMKAYEDDKMKKWERKHPKPCPDDDLFKDEMIPAWEAEREQALIRMRDLVVSMFDKLPLIGRYKISEKNAIYQEKKIADLKDVNGDGHKVNELTEESKLLKKAQKATNKEKAKNAKLVATNLKDHKRQKGRMILPEVA